MKTVQQQAEEMTKKLVETQYALGLAYYEGEGVAKDDAEAARWFQKAADQGHAWALYYFQKIHPPLRKPQKSARRILWEERLEIVGVILLLGVLVFAGVITAPIWMPISFFRERNQFRRKAMKSAAKQPQYAAEIAIYQKLRWSYGWHLAWRNRNARKNGKPLPVDIRRTIKEYVAIEKKLEEEANRKQYRGCRCGNGLLMSHPKPPTKQRGLVITKA